MTKQNLRACLPRRDNELELLSSSVSYRQPYEPWLSHDPIAEIRLVCLHHIFLLLNLRSVTQQMKLLLVTLQFDLKNIARRVSKEMISMDRSCLSWDGGELCVSQNKSAKRNKSFQWRCDGVSSLIQNILWRDYAGIEYVCSPSPKLMTLSNRVWCWSRIEIGVARWREARRERGLPNSTSLPRVLAGWLSWDVEMIELFLSQGCLCSLNWWRVDWLKVTLFFFSPYIDEETRHIDGNENHQSLDPNIVADLGRLDWNRRSWGALDDDWNELKFKTLQLLWSWWTRRRAEKLCQTASELMWCCL